jgi:hypothetical protein
VSRNAEPVTILDAVPSSDATTVRLADGREFIDVNMAMPDTDVERIRQGYVCIRCLEPQSKPFPEVCESKLPNGERWCNFPMREKQAGEFAAMYKGTVKLGSSIDVADEIARLNEINEYEERTGIVLPNHVKFPTGKI